MSPSNVEAKNIVIWIIESPLLLVIHKNLYYSSASSAVLLCVPLPTAYHQIRVDTLPVGLCLIWSWPANLGQLDLLAQDWFTLVQLGAPLWCSSKGSVALLGLSVTKCWLPGLKTSLGNHKSSPSSSSVLILVRWFGECELSIANIAYVQATELNFVELNVGIKFCWTECFFFWGVQLNWIEPN